MGNAQQGGVLDDVGEGVVDAAKGALMAVLGVAAIGVAGVALVKAPGKIMLWATEFKTRKNRSRQSKVELEIAETKLSKLRSEVGGPKV